MYSPKIREDLIPRIYRVAESDSIPMTTWVNQVMESALAAREPKNPEPRNNEPSERKENHE